MTFNQIKQAILDKAKLADVCGVYQDILIATTEPEIITAGLPLLEWAYRTGVIDDTIVDEFDEPTLNANGVYRTGTHFITNPTLDLYFLGDSSAQITLNGDNRAKIFSNTTGLINETLNDNSFIVNKIFSGGFNLVQNNNSISCNEFTNTSGATIFTNNDSVCHMKCYDGVTLTVDTHDNSFVKHQGWYNSEVFGNEYSSMPVDSMVSQQATYINNLAL